MSLLYNVSKESAAAKWTRTERMLMSAENPYDQYDAIDDWEDDPNDRDPYASSDDSGDFTFVEDEYDSMAYSGEDGLTYPQDDLDMTAARVNVSQEFPKTMVRRSFVEATRPEYLDREQPEEPRNRKRKRRWGGRAQATDAEGMSAYPNVPRPKPRRRRRRHGCLITLLILIALAVGVYWVVARPIDEKLAFSPQEQSSVNGSLSWSVPGMPYYLLALGSDARDGDQFSRTDTMVLVRVDMLGGKLTLLSIPRDTMVEIPGQGTQKINAAYAFGGVGGAVNAVSKLTGVPIHHVAVVHFDELVGLVDYLGGITVNVPVGVEYDDYSGLSIDSGVQTLDGETALSWARTRYSYERGDFQRQENQRILITAIMNRMLSLSPKQIPGALDQMGNLIGTDMRCYNLVPLFLRFKLANPVVYSTSVPSDTAMIDGVSYVVADEAALANLMRTIDAGGDPGTPVN